MSKPAENQQQPTGQPGHTPGPWIASSTTNAIIDSSGGVIGRYQFPSNKSMKTCREEDAEALANGLLFAEAPAMAICLELIALGLARIEPATKEFCFGGLRYGTLGFAAHGWTLIVNLIGWDKARAAIAKATGKAGGQ